MSKSTGNFFTLRAIAEQFPYDVIRFYLLSGHYRMPMEYGESLLASAQSGLTRIKNGRSALMYIMEKSTVAALCEQERVWLADADAFHQAFEDAMDDDFNTADAISAIFGLTRFINTHVDVNQTDGVSVPFAAALRDRLDLLCSVLGLNMLEDKKVDAWVESLIEKRREARKRKDWAAADQIRDELLVKGIVLEDTADGVRWSYKHK